MFPYTCERRKVAWGIQAFCRGGRLYRKIRSGGRRKGGAMTIVDNQMVWRQFSAALDSLGDALRACPEALWERSLWEDRAGAVGGRASRRSGIWATMRFSGWTFT